MARNRYHYDSKIEKSLKITAEIFSKIKFCRLFRRTIKTAIYPDADAFQ